MMLASLQSKAVAHISEQLHAVADHTLNEAQHTYALAVVGFQLCELWGCMTCTGIFMNGRHVRVIATASSMVHYHALSCPPCLRLCSLGAATLPFLRLLILCEVCSPSSCVPSASVDLLFTGRLCSRSQEVGTSILAVLILACFGAVTAQAACIGYKGNELKRLTCMCKKRHSARLW